MFYGGTLASLAHQLASLGFRRLHMSRGHPVLPYATLYK